MAIQIASVASRAGKFTNNKDLSAYAAVAIFIRRYRPTAKNPAQSAVQKTKPRADRAKRYAEVAFSVACVFHKNTPKKIVNRPVPTIILWENAITKNQDKG